MRYTKQFITLLSAILISATANAQRGAIEIGLGAGVSTNDNPSSNMAYTGNKGTLNYSGLLNGMYNVHRSISVGLEFRALELSRVSEDSVYNTYLKTQIGGDDKRFVYSKMMVSACAVGNGKLNIMRGYLYGGLAAGYGFSRHDSKTRGNNESYRAPDGGSGFVWGLQGGFTYGLSPAVGLNLEAALRNYSLNYDAGAPEIFPYTDLKYNITAYTITAGIKVRIMPKYKAQNDIPAFRGKGRSLSIPRPRGRRRR